MNQAPPPKRPMPPEIGFRPSERFNLSLFNARQAVQGIGFVLGIVIPSMIGFLIWLSPDTARLVFQACLIIATASIFGMAGGLIAEFWYEARQKKQQPRDPDTPPRPSSEWRA